MSHEIGDQLVVLPTHIPSGSRYCGGLSLFSGTPTVTSTTNWTANRAFFVPLIIPFDYPIARAFWYNGSAVAGNIDVGVYSIDGYGKVWSTGATAQSGTSQLQYVTVGHVLPAGNYLMAISGSSTGRLAFTAPALRYMAGAGAMEQANAHPLPNVAAPGAIATATWVLFGLTRMAS